MKKTNCLALIVVLLAFAIPFADSSAQTPAFPGAEGFGTTTAGGRSGRVIAVTNTNDSGTGSFRAAVEDSSGARIIVFRTGGTISLSSGIVIDNPYITIAGQTAPGGGICLKNGSSTSTALRIATHDVIVRGLRIRPGAGGEPDGIYVNGSGYNVVIDHCSISWAVDEVVTISNGAYDCTVSWCIISEGLYNSTHSKGDHSRGLMIGSNGSDDVTDISLHHNLLAHNHRRNPVIQGTGVTDFVNNVMYNWGEYCGDFWGQADINYVANFGKNGADSETQYLFNARNESGDGVHYYVRDSFGPSRTSTSDPYYYVIYPDDRSDTVSTRYTAPSITKVDALDSLLTLVLNNVGATKPARDSVDLRIIDDVEDSTGSIIDDPSDVGGWPTLASGTAPTDTDSDGMPDSWEDDNNLDKNSYDANDNDLDSDYDNIEVYINSLIPDPFGSSGSTTTFSLTTNTSGSGSVSLSPAGGTYDSSTVVTLTAIPDSGYKFDNWSGDLSGSTNPDSITMNANKSVTANFSQISYTVYDACGANIVTGSCDTNIVGYTGSGFANTDNSTGTYVEWTEVVVGATRSYSCNIRFANGSANTRPVNVSINDSVQTTLTFESTGAWSNWSNKHVDLYLTSDTNKVKLVGTSSESCPNIDKLEVETGSQTTQFTLTTNTSGSGSITLDPSGGTYDSSTVVTLTATADSGYQFSSWSGDLTGSANPDSITMNANKSVTATFSQISGGGEVEIAGSWTTGTTHTAESGNNRLLVFTAHAEHNATGLTLNGVSYGGKTMTEVIEKSEGSGYVAVTGIYILKEADIADASGNTFSVTWSTTPNSTPEYTSVFLTGVNQTTPTGDTQSAGGTTDTLTTSSLSTSDGDMAILASTCGNTGTYSTGGGFTEAAELTISSADGIAGYLSATGSNVTPTAIHSDANRQSLVGIVVKADSSGSSATQFTLTTNTSGSGSITLDPSGGTYDSSTVVTLTATPDSGYQFDSWSGDLTGSANPDSITMNENKSVTATFTSTALTAFIQDSGSDGIVSMEAENYDVKASQGGNSWSLDSSPPSGASGSETMEALPNDGDNINSNIETGSPRMDFRIKFVKTGTHYVWIRAYSDASSDNSLHCGLNGSVVSSADSIDYTHSQSAYVWSKSTMGPGTPDATINVSSTGVDTLNVWMREDGTVLDKIVLTTNSSYTPSSTGPSESSHSSVQYTLTTNASGSGSISLQPSGGTYDYGTEVVVTANANSGYQFDSWSGDLTGTTNPDTITMNGDKSVTATFKQMAWQQDSGSDGIVSIEIEHYDSKASQGGNSWDIDGSPPSGATNDTTMQALPNDDDNVNTNIESSSPRLDYIINFVKTGTHYIWIRAYSDSSSGNSIHYGLNGSVVSTADSVDYPHSQSAYVWAKRTMGGDGDARINIASIGIDTLNIWMREDGTMLDKIVLTTNSNYTPSGSGPSESSRALSKALVPEEELVEETEVALPTEYSLSHYPNPFNPSTKIIYTLPVQEHVELAVFDIMGRRVSVLFDGIREAGSHTYTWHAVDANGQSLASGVYFCRIRTSSFVKSIKMTYIR